MTVYRTLSVCICEYLIGTEQFSAARLLLAVVDLQNIFLFYDMCTPLYRNINKSNNQRYRKFNKYNTHGYRESSHFYRIKSHNALDEAMLARWNRDNPAKSARSGSAWRPRSARSQKATNRRSFSSHKNK